MERKIKELPHCANAQAAPEKGEGGKGVFVLPKSRGHTKDEVIGRSSGLSSQHLPLPSGLSNTGYQWLKLGKSEK